MAILHAAADAESTVVDWLKTTDLADPLTRPDGGINIFQAMPLGAPVPVVLVKRIGGSIPDRSDIPYEQARISFDCQGVTRAALWSDVVGLLIGIINNLGELGGWASPAGIRLYSATHLSTRWLPDRESDLPRYVVDGLFYLLDPA